MGRYRFVDAEEVRLPLSDGDYIDVKRVLNAGEYRQMIYAQFKDRGEGESPTLDYAKIGLAKLLAYLLGWSFVNKLNQPEPYSIDQPEEIRRALLDNLDQETYREVIAAIEAHETAQAAKKNLPVGVTP